MKSIGTPGYGNSKEAKGEFTSVSDDWRTVVGTGFWQRWDLYIWSTHRDRGLERYRITHSNTKL